MVAEPLAEMPGVHVNPWETARLPSTDSLDSTPSFELTRPPQAAKKSRGSDQISDKSGGTARSSSETATTRRGLTRGDTNQGARERSPRRQGTSPSPINPPPGMTGGGGRFPGGAGSTSYNIGNSGDVSNDNIIQQLQREMFKLREEVEASRRVQTNWDTPNFQGGNDWGGNYGNYGGNIGGVNPNGVRGYGGNFAGKGSSPYGPYDGFVGNSGYQKRKTVLDERFFRRVDTFEGDAQKYRDWKFNLLVGIGQADPELQYGFSNGSTSEGRL